MLNVSGQDHVGVATYGLAALGQRQPRTAHSFIPELEAELVKDNVGRLSVDAFTNKLSEFFMLQWQKSDMPSPKEYAEKGGPDMVFLVAGIDEDEPYGRVREIGIPNNLTPKIWHENGFGATWGGQTEFVDRMINGFDRQLLSILSKETNLSPEDITTLNEKSRNQLGVRIPYQFLPLQDCVDFAIFLIRSTISLQSLVAASIRGVGGAIDVATITRSEGFRHIQRKTIMGERVIHQDILGGE